jgi:hypothetical protein
MSNSTRRFQTWLQFHKWTHFLLSKIRVHEEFLMDYLKSLMSFSGSEVSDEL